MEGFIVGLSVRVVRGAQPVWRPPGVGPPDEAKCSLDVRVCTSVRVVFQASYVVYGPLRVSQRVQEVQDLRLEVGAQALEVGLDFAAAGSPSVLQLDHHVADGAQMPVVVWRWWWWRGGCWWSSPRGPRLWFRFWLLLFLYGVQVSLALLSLVVLCGCGSVAGLWSSLLLTSGQLLCLGSPCDWSPGEVVVRPVVVVAVPPLGWLVGLWWDADFPGSWLEGL